MRSMPQNWKKFLRHGLVAMIVAACLAASSVPAHAETFRIAIMQAEKGAAEHFAPLAQYLDKRGIQVKLVPTASYTDAALMFAEGKADGMFSGSGVAASMIIKDLAYPVVRPVDREGISTYWAVVVAPKGAPSFVPGASYFKGKRVVFCALASAGEFFVRSIPGALQAAREVTVAPSHGAAIEAVAKGQADIAIVKNRVWDNVKARYPGLVELGSDAGQNPNNTLIISKKTDPAIVKRLTGVLLALQNDASPEAQAAREGLDIIGYIITSANDFQHTMGLLRSAGVDKSFDFHF
jgi:ABC-type phosphate/phosphonate transport system substrate-binding protein